MEGENKETPHVIDLVIAGRWSEASEHIKTCPESIYERDRYERSVLHIICENITVRNNDGTDGDEHMIQHQQYCELARLIIDTSIQSGLVYKDLHGHCQTVLTLRDYYGCTPFRTLSSNSFDPSLTKMLLDSAAGRSHNKSSAYLPTAHEMITAEDKCGYTPFHCIAEAPRPYSAAKLMISYCDPTKDPTVLQDEDGDTVLHWACNLGASKRLLRHLLKKSSAALMVQNNRFELPIDEYIHRYLVKWETTEDQARAFEMIDFLVRAFHDSLDCPEDWWPLHALVRTPFCRPYLLEIALLTQLGQVTTWDDRGMLPLHAALSCRDSQSFDCHRKDGALLLDRIPSMIRLLLQYYPYAATLCTQNGRLPLHLAVESGKGVGVIKKLLEITPDALTCRDCKTKLYPFMLAAVGDSCGIDVVYELLSANPELVRTGVSEKAFEKRRTRKRVRETSDLQLEY